MLIGIVAGVVIVSALVYVTGLTKQVLSPFRSSSSTYKSSEAATAPDLASGDWIDRSQRPGNLPRRDVDARGDVCEQIAKLRPKLKPGLVESTVLWNCDVIRAEADLFQTERAPVEIWIELIDNLYPLCGSNASAFQFNTSLTPPCPRGLWHRAGLE